MFSIMYFNVVSCASNDKEELRENGSVDRGVRRLLERLSAYTKQRRTPKYFYPSGVDIFSSSFISSSPMLSISLSFSILRRFHYRKSDSFLCARVRVLETVNVSVRVFIERGGK